jgi:hypothetical protein
MRLEIDLVKLIISGSRDFTNSKVFMDAMIDAIAEIQYKNEVHMKDLEIIHGGAKGIDSMADVFARGYKLKLKVFPADWNTFGKSAGMKRNLEMLYYAISYERHFLLAFNMNSSRGTSGMIDVCKKKNVPSYIFNTKDGENLKLECFELDSKWKEKYK